MKNRRAQRHQRMVRSVASLLGAAGGVGNADVGRVVEGQTAAQDEQYGGDHLYGQAEEVGVAGDVGHGEHHADLAAKWNEGGRGG